LDDSRLSFDERRKRQLDVQIMLTMLDKDKHAKNGKETIKKIYYTVLHIHFTQVSIIFYILMRRDYRDRYNKIERTGSGRWTERRISGVQ